MRRYRMVMVLGPYIKLHIVFSKLISYYKPLMFLTLCALEPWLINSLTRMVKGVVK